MITHCSNTPKKLRQRTRSNIGKTSTKDFYDNMGSPKVFVFSVPFGSVAGKTIDGVRPYLQ